MSKLWLLAVVACGGGSSEPLPDAPKVTTFPGQVVDGSGAGIAGASICVLHSELACQTTDGAGNFSFPLPSMPGAQLAVEVTANGYVGVVSLDAEPVAANGVMTALFPAEVTLISAAQAATTLGSAGIAYPGTGGFLDLRLSGDTAIDLSGATVAIAPAGGVGPVYFGSDGMLDPALTSSTTNGYVRFGDLPAGQYDLTASAPNKTCSATPATGGVIAGDWPPTAAGTTTRIEIADNAWTLGVVIFCL